MVERIQREKNSSATIKLKLKARFCRPWTLINLKKNINLSESKVCKIELLALVLLLHLSFSLFVFFQPCDVVFVLSVDEELNEWIINQFSCCSSLIWVFLQTSIQEIC